MYALDGEFGCCLLLYMGFWGVTRYVLFLLSLRDAERGLLGKEEKKEAKKGGWMLFTSNHIERLSGREK